MGIFSCFVSLPSKWKKNYFVPFYLHDPYSSYNPYIPKDSNKQKNQTIISKTDSPQERDIKEM